VKTTNRVERLAQAILDGDSSMLAANALEGALIEEVDDPPEELMDTLGLYAPGQGAPYSDFDELCAVIRRTLPNA
jgi:hypothetical protein